MARRVLFVQFIEAIREVVRVRTEGRVIKEGLDQSYEILCEAIQNSDDLVEFFEYWTAWSEKGAITPEARLLMLRQIGRLLRDKVYLGRACGRIFDRYVDGG